MSGDKDALIYLADVRIDELEVENAKLREERDMYRDLVGMMDHPDLNAQLQAENAKLREQMERLVTLLRVDCDIDASWDGLRRFWSIELTESGCLMRDRACKAEAESAKLRELVRHLRECTRHNVCAACEYADDACDFDYDMRELGVEVGA